MSGLPYDQRLARELVRPLARTPMTPNHAVPRSNPDAFTSYFNNLSE